MEERQRGEYLRYPTYFDIYGTEFYIYDTKLNEAEGISIELYYGRKVEERASSPRLILTKELKELVENNPKRYAHHFGEFLPRHKISMLRRELKQNPYESYEAWCDSKDENKPKEIRCLDAKTNPQIITDYLGAKHVIYSAYIAKNGMIIPVGTSLVEFKKKKNKAGPTALTSILTKELAAYIKANRDLPTFTNEELSMGRSAFYGCYKKLEITTSVYDDANMWLASHLVEIRQASSSKIFVEKYITSRSMGVSAIMRFKKGLNALVKYRKSQDKKEQELLSIIQSVEEVDAAKVNKQLAHHIGMSDARVRTKAYKALMIARDYKYVIPEELKKILKNKKPKQDKNTL